MNVQPEIIKYCKDNGYPECRFGTSYKNPGKTSLIISSYEDFFGYWTTLGEWNTDYLNERLDELYFYDSCCARIKTYFSEKADELESWKISKKLKALDLWEDNKNKKSPRRELV